ncbi:MAG: hypothetical protein ACAH88_10720 [Roseimicrobium sp.]
MSNGPGDSDSDASTDSWERNRKLLLLLGMVLFIVMDVLAVLWFFSRSEGPAIPRPEPVTGTLEQTPSAPQ